MLNLNIDKINDTVPLEVIEESEFISRFIGRCAPEEVFERQGDKHEDYDIALSESIDSYLEQVFARGSGSEVWVQSEQCNGDGISAISFTAAADFKENHLLGLLALLNGKFELFSILCRFYEDFEDGADIGSIGIFKGQVLISEGIIKQMPNQKIHLNKNCRLI
ncbi:MAG: hypothetical protein HWE27_16320 [Gammaproteobacteria bacterium]|nr:hypothetical protein [Gammaproteobacteria bacterium]